MGFHRGERAHLGVMGARLVFFGYFCVCGRGAGVGVTNPASLTPGHNRPRREARRAARLLWRLLVAELRHLGGQQRLLKVRQRVKHQPKVAHLR